MCNNRECATYLKKNSAYNRLMKELRKKWESYGRISGSITLNKTSEEERRGIGGIVGKTFSNEAVKITFKEFEQGLQKTRFAPIDMKLVLEQYFESTLYTNQEQRNRVHMAKIEFFEQLMAYFEARVEKTSIVLSWISALQCEKKYGYQILIKEYSKDSEMAKNLAKNVGKALIQLEAMDGEECFLAVFSARISGNPHYFDRGTTAAQLLTHAVCFWKNYDAPKLAYEWRECMQMVGLVSDNIASMVHGFGVRLETKDGLHPAYEAFNNKREPYVITAENMKSITGAKAYKNKVYVVENEMVFLYLVENVKQHDVTILCTSGQLRVAAFQLLEAFISNGAVIYYSGDLDSDGMDIADRLWKKYGDSIHLWRMDTDSYYKSISEESLSDRQLVKLENFENSILRLTAESVRNEKNPAYQENLLKELLKDILNSI